MYIKKISIRSIRELLLADISFCRKDIVGHTLMLSWEMASENVFCIFCFDNEYFKRFHRSIF